ncbi:hypothetical protein [Polynucleobacter sp. 15G-AUS-farblos]|uniref:hypothetical protein n=1 Tax=Polynucleobacter sp. 15G-AUS-farblos TaxID=2689094 RepID=UPI001C0AA0B5|nr:hypothetical protein [Polynucleobacter sp. 15G-AUS-farblos]
MALWIAIGCALNFLSAYWVLRRLSFSALASGVGAFLFASSLPTLGEPDHAQLIYRFAIPLSFYYFWLAIGNINQTSSSDSNVSNLYRPALLGWSLLWATEQLYCSIYLGIFLVYLLLATAIAQLVLSPKGYLRNLWKSWQITQTRSKFIGIALSTVSIIGIATLLLKYLMVAKDYGYSWSTDEILSMLPRLTSYLIADRSSISAFVGASVDNIAWRAPHQLFIGIGPAIALICGLIFTWNKTQLSFLDEPSRRIKYLGKIASFTLVLLFIATISIADHSIYSYLLKLPGINGLRVVTRIILVMLLPISILAAIAAQYVQLQILLRPPQKLIQRNLSIGAVTILICAESLFCQIPTTPFSTWQQRIDTARTLLPNSLDPDAILFSTQKLNEWDYMTSLDAMILAQDLGVPTINGFSGQSPPGKVYRAPDRCFTEIDRLQAYAQYRHLDPEQVQALAKRIVVLNTDQLRPRPNFGMASIEPGQSIDFSNRVKDADRPIEFICGWSHPDTWGRWSTRAIAKLAVPLPTGIADNANTPSAKTIIVKVRALIDTKNPQQRVDIWVDGFYQKSVVLKNGGEQLNTIDVTIPPHTDKYALLEFRLPDRISTKILGPQFKQVLGGTLNTASDEREPAIGIVSIQFQ